MNMGFSHCKDSDPCVYVLRDMVVGIYVDDILIIGSTQAIDRFKNDLSSKMKIKDLGNVSVILSLRVQKHDHSHVSIDQSLYVKDVLAEFDMTVLEHVARWKKQQKTGTLQVNRENSIVRFNVRQSDVCCICRATRDRI